MNFFDTLDADLDRLHIRFTKEILNRLERHEVSQAVENLGHRVLLHPLRCHIQRKLLAFGRAYANILDVEHLNEKSANLIHWSLDMASNFVVNHRQFT